MIEQRRRRAVHLYRGCGFIGLTLPWADVVLLRSLAWLYPGWWYWGRVAGSLIVRAGPCVVTVWSRQ